MFYHNHLVLRPDACSYTLLCTTQHIEARCTIVRRNSPTFRHLPCHHPHLAGNKWVCWRRKESGDAAWTCYSHPLRGEKKTASVYSRNKALDNQVWPNSLIFEQHLTIFRRRGFLAGAGTKEEAAKQRPVSSIYLSHKRVDHTWPVWQWLCNGVPPGSHTFSLLKNSNCGLQATVWPPWL